MNSEQTSMIRALAGRQKLWERPAHEVAIAYTMLAYLAVLPSQKGFKAAMLQLDEGEREQVEYFFEAVCRVELTTMDVPELCKVFGYFADVMGGSPDLTILAPTPGA